MNPGLKLPSLLSGPRGCLPPLPQRAVARPTARSHSPTVGRPNPARAAPLPQPSLAPIDTAAPPVGYVAYLATLTQIPRRLRRLPSPPRARRYRLNPAKRISTRTSRTPPRPRHLISSTTRQRPSAQTLPPQWPCSGPARYQPSSG